MKKRITTLLFLIIVAVLLVMGCTPATPTQGSNDPAAATEKAADPTKAPDASVDGEEAEEPEAFDPVTISMLTVRWGHMDDKFKDNSFFKALEERTNITIDWQVQYSTDWEEQKSIMFASRNLPDTIFGSNGFTDMDYANNLDFFIPLDDLIDSHMPNLQKAFADNDDFRRICVFDDGHIYTLPKNLPCRPEVTQQWFINQIWLDNVGMEMPTTLDELTAVLRAFKEQDANGNGDPNDEIPTTRSGFGGIYSFLTQFGVIDSAEYKGNDNGAFFFEATSEEYKTGIKWLHELYKEGILDNECITQDSTMFNAKVKNPDIPIVGYIYCWTPDSEVPDFYDQYVPIPAQIMPDGNQYVAGLKSIDRREFAVTTFCENPEAAVRWADEFYTNVASIENFWGPIGDGVIRENADGTYEVMSPPEGVSMDSHAWNMTQRDFGPKYTTKEFESKVIIPDSISDGQKLGLAKALDPYVVKIFPLVMYTLSELEELPMLTTDIKSYVETTGAKWITQGGVDEEWGAYVQQLEAMGLQDLINIRQAALDRYNAN